MACICAFSTPQWSRISITRILSQIHCRKGSRVLVTPIRSPAMLLLSVSVCLDSSICYASAHSLYSLRYPLGRIIPKIFTQLARAMSDRSPFHQPNRRLASAGVSPRVGGDALRFANSQTRSITFISAKLYSRMNLAAVKSP